MLGHAYYLTEQYAEAIAALSKTVDRQPDFLPSRFLLAGCFWNLGQQEKSLAEFEKIERLIPSSLPEAWKQFPYRDQMHADRFLEALWGLGLKI